MSSADATTLLINHNKNENSTDESEWNRAISGYSTLVKKSAELNAIDDRVNVDSIMKNFDPNYKNNSSLKMQKQDDIRNMIARDNNIIIFTGIGLAIIAITSISIYKSNR